MTTYQDWRRALTQTVLVGWLHADAVVKRRFASAICLMIVSSSLMALGPLAMKIVIDSLGSRNNDRTWAMLLIGGYVASLWLSRVASEMQNLLYARAERRLYRMIAERVFGHLMSLPLSFHFERQTGGITQTIENGLLGMQLVLHTIVFSALPVLIELSAVVLILSRVEQLAFAALFGSAVVLYAYAFRYFAKVTAAAARDASSAQVDSAAKMTDALLNVETLKSYAAEHLINARVSSELSRTEAAWIRFYKRFALNGIVVATIFGAFLAVSCIYAIHLVEAGRITIGTFVLVNSYMLQVVRPVEMLGTASQAATQGIAFLERMLELLRQRPEYSTTSAPATPPRVGSLAFENVTFSYRSGCTVLKNISFSAGPRAVLGVVGPSGAGKSSLMRLALRLVSPDEGRILLNGVPLTALTLRELRTTIAVVPQDTVLLNETIRFNVALGSPGCSDEAIERACRAASLHDMIMRLPDGYDTLVGERGVKLSGGEKQRLAIARAVLRNAAIFILDEPTSSLDSQTEQNVLDRLLLICQPSTAIVISHRLSAVMGADEIVVLNQGTIVERGTHAQLVRNGGTYSKLWNAQATERTQGWRLEPAASDIATRSDIA